MCIVLHSRQDKQGASGWAMPSVPTGHRGQGKHSLREHPCQVVTGVTRFKKNGHQARYCRTLCALSSVARRSSNTSAWAQVDPGGRGVRGVQHIRSSPGRSRGSRYIPRSASPAFKLMHEQAERWRTAAAGDRGKRCCPAACMQPEALAWMPWRDACRRCCKAEAEMMSA